MVKVMKAKPLYFLVLSSALALGRFNPAAQADELKISSPKTTLIQYEPAFINLSGKIKKLSRGAISFIVTRSGQTRKYPEVAGMEPAHATRKLNDGLIQVTAEWALWFWDSHVFPEPGNYTVSIHESIGKLDSNELEFEVRAIPAPELEASKLFSSRSVIEDLLTGLTTENSLRPYEELLLRFPESEYTKYAAFLLLNHELKKFKDAPIRVSELVQQSDELATKWRRYKMVRSLPSPSLWHSFGLLKLAEGNLFAQQAEAASSDLTLLKKIYPDHKEIKLAEEMLQDAEKNREGPNSKPKNP
jgi:hypothetical protein